MTSVCIVSPAWGRVDVTRLVLEQRRRVCGDLASRGVDAGMIIAADDENLDVAAELGCDTVNVPNKPLGTKCNALLHHAGDTGADWIVWIGSDDWIHPAVFDPIFEGTPERPVILSGHKLAIVNMAAGQLQRIETPSPYGAIPWLLDGRMIRDARRRFSGDRIGPIRDDLERGLDGGLIRGIRMGRVEFGWDYSDPTDFRCVDFKTRANITPYEGLARNLGVGDPEPAWTTLAKHFPADLVQKAAALAKRFGGDE